MEAQVHFYTANRKKNIPDSVQKQIYMVIQQVLHAESSSWQPGGHEYAPENTVQSGKLEDHWQMTLTMKKEQKEEKEIRDKKKKF